MPRIHITGASGSGASTLGNNLSKALGYPFFDTDNYYWEKTDPPFQVKTDVHARLEKMHADLSTATTWILSGSLDGWGDPLVPFFDLVIFIRLDQETRMKRLQQREFDRFGHKVLPDGEQYQSSQKFLDWAAEYESGKLSGRSLKRHEDWLMTLPCPVLRLSSDQSPEDMVQEALESDIFKRVAEHCSIPLR